MQVAVVNQMKEKSRGTFRAKQLRMNFHRQTGQTPPNARGIGGCMSETVFFFYKGTWPGKLDLAPRELFGGTPWDDMWLDVPHCGRMEQFSVPLSVKGMVFDDLWSSQSTQNQEKEATDDEGDEAGQAASASTKTDAKDETDAKVKEDTKNKKEAKLKKDAKDAKGKKAFKGKKAK